MTTILKLEPSFHLSAEQFKSIVSANPSAHLELTATGELVVMSPTGGESGIRNMEICFQLQLWVKTTKLGVAFDSSTMFELPDGSFRSPDAAWIESSRWNQLTEAQRQTFPPISPDLAIELRSLSDSLSELREKMKHYAGNGVKLGWLINPQAKQVEIYRLGQEDVEVISSPASLSGEDVLLGFVLDLSVIW